MKGKNVFFALGLSLVMGLGAVAALASNREVQKAEAATLDNGTVVYLDFGGDGHGWADANASVYAWTWYSTGSKWENVSYDSTTGFHKFTLSDVGATGFTLLREDSSLPARSGKDFGNTEGWWNKLDANFEEGKNLLNATSTTSFDEWESFTGNVYGLVGDFNDWGEKDGNKTDVLLTGDGTTKSVQKYLHQHAKAKIRLNYRWNLSYGYSNLVAGSKTYFTDDDGNMQTVDAGTYTFNFNSSSKDISVNVLADVPAEDGYYIVGTATDWKYSGATKMSTDPEEVGSDIAVYKGYVASSVNEEIKVRSYISGVDTWYGDNETLATTDGTYDIYLNSSEEVYVYHNEPDPVTVYTVKIGEAAPFAIALNEGTEYMTAEMDFDAGDEVSVLYKGAVDNSFHLKEIGNNNVNGDGEVLLNAHGRVYIDVNAKTIFVGGLKPNGYHLVVNDDYIEMTQNNEPLDPSFIEFYSSLIDFKENDVVKFVDTTGLNPSADYANIFDITTIDPKSVDGFTVVGGSLKASKDLSCSVYLKIKSGFDNVYFGTYDEEVALAKNFAKDFTDAFDAICQESGQDDDYVAGLASEWQSQKTTFEGLHEKVQNVLKEATKSHDVKEIREFISAYEYIAGKYKTRLGADYNFLLKEGLESNKVVRIMNVTNQTTLIVVLVATITTISAIGLFLVIKRRKEVK